MRKPSPFLWFILPAVVVITCVIVFPWMFTLWMSLFDWKIGSKATFAGLGNYADLLTNARFLESIAHTLIFTTLAVVAPLVLGTAAALVFNQQFAWRGFWRGAFVLPMMATPVAIALVWVMMFHPQQGVLNYLLSLVGIGPSEWVYSPKLAILCLVMVDVWQWTPLVMLIVLGGLTSLPPEPFEAASIDGASAWQTFRYLTLPMLRPYIVVAALFRGIDAIKTFDTIYVITKGGPAFASETLNLYIYSNAFEYLHIGYSSAMLVVFFALVLGLSLLLIRVRRVPTT